MSDFDNLLRNRASKPFPPSTSQGSPLPMKVSENLIQPTHHSLQPAQPPTPSSGKFNNLNHISVVVAVVTSVVAIGLYFENRDRSQIRSEHFKQVEVSSPPEKPSITDGSVRALAEAQVELAKQKAQLEEMRREQDLERQRVVAAEQQAKHTQQQAMVQAEDEHTLESWENVIGSRSNELGKRLITCTHPTGTYTSTDIPITTRSADRKQLSVNLTVQWKGATVFSPDSYSTTFSFRLSKTGLDRFSISDTAFVPISENNKTEARTIIHDLFLSGADSR